VTAVLEISDIHTYYGNSYVLQGVSLAVPPGRVVAVLGRNGVGKTTLMRSIIGFTPPRRGTIRFNGASLAGLPAHRIARLGIALVPQGRRMFRSLTVQESLEIASQTRRYDKAGRSWPIAAAYEAFPRLAERRANRTGKLSGGEQQMVATARAMVGNPQLLLLDEPTEGLAPILVQHLESILHGLKADGMSMLLVEQQIPFALRLADEVCVMSKGQVVWRGAPDALEGDHDARERYLGF
jgi:branched-chain amino acid transport system ATP-binding protein